MEFEFYLRFPLSFTPLVSKPLLSAGTNAQANKITIILKLFRIFSAIVKCLEFEYHL